MDKELRRNEMKKNTVILLTSILLCLSSCRLFFNHKDADILEDSRILCTVTGSVGINLTKINEADRTAIPVVDITAPEYSTLTYTVKAVNLADSSVETGTVNTGAAVTYEISLPDGEFEITVNAYTDSDQLLTGSTKITVVSHAVSEGSTAVNLTGLTASTGKVKLPVKIAADSEITSAKACWEVGGVAKEQTLTLDSNAATPVLSTDFTMVNNGDMGQNVPSGAYQVKFIFYKGSNVAYSFIELVNVFDNLETTKWIDNVRAVYLTGGQVNITKTLVKSYLLKSFYVDPSGGSDANPGGFFEPVASVQRAVNLISAINDGYTSYSIYLMGDVTAASAGDFVALTGLENSFVAVDPLLKLKLRIASSDNTKKKISANALGRVLYINPKTDVTLERLLITKGNCTDGAGIFIDKDASNTAACILNDCEVSGNTAVNGGGVYLKGALSLDSTSAIKYNTATASGGGIYAAGGSLKGTSVTNNTATVSGGGIYVADDLSVEGKITVVDNKAGTEGALIDSNVLLPSISDVLRKLKVTGPLTSSEIRVTVNVTPGTESTTIAFTSGFKTRNPGVTPQTYFYSDNNLLIGPDADGEACLSVTSGIFAPGTYDNVKFELCDGTSAAANKVSMVSTAITEPQTLYLLAKLEDNSGAAPVYTDITDKVTEWHVELRLGQVDAIAAGTGITMNSENHSFTIPTGSRSDNYAVYVSGIYNGRRYGTTIPLSISNYAVCTLAELQEIMQTWADNLSTGDCYIKLTDSAPQLPSADGTLSLNSILRNENYEYMPVFLDLTACTGLTEIKANAFLNCSNLKQVSLPESVTKIGDYAFQNCIAMTKISITDNPAFTTVGKYAFDGDRILPEVILPSSTTAMGNYAFYNCYKLDTMPLPENLQSIGISCFNGCKALREAVIPAAVTKLETSTFSGCKALKVTLHNNITSIGSYCFRDCSNLNITSLPENLTTIGTYAFYGCSAIQRIDIPAGVTSIPDSCFYGCSLLSAVTLPDSLSTIGSSAFSKTAITTITIPDSVTGALDGFINCSKLTQVNIGTGITSIAAYCFYYCSSLVTIEIPDGVTSIGSYAFSYCSKLTDVIFTNGGYSDWKNSSGVATGWTTSNAAATTLKSSSYAYKR